MTMEQFIIETIKGTINDKTAPWIPLILFVLFLFLLEFKYSLFGRIFNIVLKQKNINTKKHNMVNDQDNYINSDNSETIHVKQDEIINMLNHVRHQLDSISEKLEKLNDVSHKLEKINITLNDSIIRNKDNAVDINIHIKEMASDIKIMSNTLSDVVTIVRSLSDMFYMIMMNAKNNNTNNTFKQL